MTVEEYRHRMIQAFHNAGCDELIAICVLPAGKEFEHLEWLLKKHYKKEPCDDAISRQAVLDHIYGINGLEGFELSNVFEKHYADFIKSLPSVSAEKKVNVLDKIRAEIESISVNGQVDEHTMFVRSGEQVKRMVLEIIDKYKAESEG